MFFKEISELEFKLPSLFASVDTHCIENAIETFTIPCTILVGLGLSTLIRQRQKLRLMHF